MPHPFDRDLGYLLPFLGRVIEYAEAQPEPLRGALLAELSGETARWAAIQALLDGAAPNTTPTPKPTPAETPRPGLQPGWTIGPLSPKPTKP
ncbi:MAG: hypothetical protein IPI35_07195 [Deltaproteobacteria bacterium]|nr:hypothetical protein [Deltaproteobacteria bacterium]